MPLHAPASPDQLPTSTVFEALKRSAGWLMLLSASLGAATFGVLSMMAPRYQSEAELAIVAKGPSNASSDPQSASGAPAATAPPPNMNAIGSVVRALRSPAILERTATDLKLGQRREFNSALGPVDPLDAALRRLGIGAPHGVESERDRVLAALRNHLEIYAVEGGHAVSIRATSVDPVLAAKIANAIAENYRASLAEQPAGEMDDRQAALQLKIGKLSTEVANAETEVDHYRSQIGDLSASAQSDGLSDQQISDLTAELAKATAARSEAEARAQSAREMMKAGTAEALTEVQKSPLIQDLVQQRLRTERQISELSATLLPGHPQMRQLNSDLAGLKLQINAEIAKIVANLDKDAKIARGREDSIKQSLVDIKAQAASSAPEETQLQQLEAAAEAKRTELGNLRQQFEENGKKLDSRGQPVEAQIVFKAQPASVPVSPKKLQLSGLMSVASLMFGTAWVMVRALFRGAPAPRSRGRTAAGRGRAEPSLAARQAEPLLREMTELDRMFIPGDERRTLSELQSETHAFEAPSMFLGDEELQALAERLMRHRPAAGGHRSLITGESEQVVPFDEAVELARALAGAGAQVILVDWSTNGAGLASMLDLPVDVGLNDLLRGEASFDDIIQRLPGTGAHAITSGSAMRDAEVEIDPAQLNLVLDALDESYDYIVVVGRHDEARNLFEVVEGRFDAGIAVALKPSRAPVSGDRTATFLGFEVAEIDIIQFVRQSTDILPIARRIVRAAPRRELMATRA